MTSKRLHKTLIFFWWVCNAKKKLFSEPESLKFHHRKMDRDRIPLISHWLSSRGSVPPGHLCASSAVPRVASLLYQDISPLHK